MMVFVEAVQLSLILAENCSLVVFTSGSGAMVLARYLICEIKFYAWPIAFCVSSWVISGMEVTAVGCVS